MFTLAVLSLMLLDMFVPKLQTFNTLPEMCFQISFKSVVQTLDFNMPSLFRYIACVIQ